MKNWLHGWHNVHSKSHTILIFLFKLSAFHSGISLEKMNNKKNKIKSTFVYDTEICNVSDLQSVFGWKTNEMFF